MQRATRMAALAGGLALMTLAPPAESRDKPARPAEARVAIRLFREPRVVLTGDAMVYVADDPALRFDGDLFRYGQYWYAHRDRRWYRALGYDGTFKPLEKRRVPRAVMAVPKRFWKPAVAHAAGQPRRAGAQGSTPS